ncbi:trypsin-like peptidase domain-containing protein [Streptomyces sp. NPDC002838]|uniref:VMAP-C domain-containing protein n=1 Tax=Streptomyces sp. NPDC002838 TaxID=3154436 RepID=UPI0033336C73
MGWFRPSDDTAPTLVSVLHKGSSSAAGAGALLSSRYVLTCAHVVSLALGKDRENTEQPRSSDRLSLELHDEAVTHRRMARLAVWVPPRPSPRGALGEGDLAVLELDEPAGASTRPVAWQPMTERAKVRAWHASGARITGADTTIEISDTWYYYADADLSGASIQEGYSGSPLFKKDTPAVAVGLVIEHVVNHGPLSDRHTSRRTLALPWQRIREELARKEARRVLDACLPPASPDLGAVPDNAVDLLLELFEGAELKRHARLLAPKLGYRMLSEEPDPAALSLEEELAVLLFTEKRALATLVASLTKAVREDRRKTLNKLLALGCLVEGVRLLSVGEHEELRKILRRVNSAHPGLFCRAARRVLEFDSRTPDWLDSTDMTESELAAAAEDLDGYYDYSLEDGDVPRMPRLLRLAVFLSAAVADKGTRDELNTWCENVHKRLGVDRSLLIDCRVLASSWATFRRRPAARISVALSRSDSDRERYDCRIWLVRKGRVPHRVAVGDGPFTAEEIGRKIDGAAREHRNGGDEPAPWIEVVVGREDLHVPVDAWTACSVLDRLAHLGVPPPPGQHEKSRVLGAEYRVALRLREYADRADREDERCRSLRRRWEAGRAAPIVIRDKATDVDAVDKAVSALEGVHRDTAWAVLHGDPKDRHYFLEVCLALGVPVVLWDREATGLEHAQRLEDIVGGVSLSDVPDVVQGFRKAVHHDGEPFAARPAMVWDDPDMPLPPLPDYCDPPDAPRNLERLAAR